MELHAFIVAIFNQISNQNVRLIIAISGKAVYKYRYQISECTFLLLPFSLPTRQSIFPGTQVFYLVDESEETGKGANSVVSMLHHHFQYILQKENKKILKFRK
jgi:hypothetical protein